MCYSERAKTHNPHNILYIDTPKQNNILFIKMYANSVNLLVHNIYSCEYMIVCMLTALIKNDYTYIY